AKTQSVIFSQHALRACWRSFDPEVRSHPRWIRKALRQLPPDRSRSVTKTLGQDPPALTIKGGLCGTQVRSVSLLGTITAAGQPQATRAEEHQYDKPPAPTRVGCVQQGVDGDFADDEQRAR